MAMRPPGTRWKDGRKYAKQKDRPIKPKIHLLLTTDDIVSGIENSSYLPAKVDIMQSNVGYIIAE